MMQSEEHRENELVTTTSLREIDATVVSRQVATGDVSNVALFGYRGDMQIHCELGGGLVTGCTKVDLVGSRLLGNVSAESNHKSINDVVNENVYATEAFRDEK